MSLSSQEREIQKFRIEFQIAVEKIRHREKEMRYKSFNADDISIEVI